MKHRFKNGATYANADDIDAYIEGDELLEAAADRPFAGVSPNEQDIAKSVSTRFYFWLPDEVGLLQKGHFAERSLIINSRLYGTPVEAARARRDALATLSKKRLRNGTAPKHRISHETETPRCLNFVICGSFADPDVAKWQGSYMYPNCFCCFLTKVGEKYDEGDEHLERCTRGKGPLPHRGLFKGVAPDRRHRGLFKGVAPDRSKGVTWKSFVNGPDGKLLQVGRKFRSRLEAARARRDWRYTPDPVASPGDASPGVNKSRKRTSDATVDAAVDATVDVKKSSRPDQQKHTTLTETDCKLPLAEPANGYAKAPMGVLMRLANLERDVLGAVQTGSLAGRVGAVEVELLGVTDSGTPVMKRISTVELKMAGL